MFPIFRRVGMCPGCRATSCQAYCYPHQNHAPQESCCSLVHDVAPLNVHSQSIRSGQLGKGRCKKTKSPDSDVEAERFVLLVAGVGFEPTTFGL
jgi:hypothetical protein